MNSTEIKQIVKETYGQAATQAKSGARSCCGPSCNSAVDSITKALYSVNEMSELPEKAILE